MSWLPKIEKQYIAEPLSDGSGYYLYTYWRYNEDLPLALATGEIDADLDGRLEPLWPYPVLWFPEVVPQGTTYPLASGGTWETPHNAYIKEFDLDDCYFDTASIYVLLWGAIARYSYTIKGDLRDDPPPEEWEPVTYPEGTTQYVPLNGWPDAYPDYARWIEIAGRSNYYPWNFSCRPGWSLLVQPEESDAYALLHWSSQGTCQLSGDDYDAYVSLEGHGPLETLESRLTAYGITWRRWSISTTQTTQVWTRPTPVDHERNGFYRPYESPIGAVNELLLGASLLFAELGLISTRWTGIPARLYPRIPDYLLGDSTTGLLGDSTTGLLGRAY